MQPAPKQSPPGQLSMHPSPKNSSNLDETPSAIRKRWQKLEAELNGRKFVKRISSARKLKLPAADIRTLIARVVLSDPTLDVLDLTNHAQMIGLSGAQKVKALEQMSCGTALQVVKLVSVCLDNACAPALSKLFKSRHPLQCVSLEGERCRLERMAHSCVSHLNAKPISLEGHGSLGETPSPET